MWERDRLDRVTREALGRLVRIDDRRVHRVERGTLNRAVTRTSNSSAHIALDVARLAGLLKES
jgi:hypothetical protein